MTDKVLEVAETDSMVWVHDYPLLLLPSFLLRKLPGEPQTQPAPHLRRPRPPRF